MKIILITTLLILLPTLALSSPFLICDPQVNITKYELEVNGTILGQYPAQGDGSVKIDLVGYSSGTYRFKLRAMGADNWWGEWSDPFDATKPAKSGGVRIIP